MQQKGGLGDSRAGSHSLSQGRERIRREGKGCGKGFVCRVEG